MSVLNDHTTAITDAGRQDDQLLEVYRQLVAIHASIAEATNDDREIVPWTEREMRGVRRYIEAVRRGGQPAMDRNGALGD